MDWIIENALYFWLIVAITTLIIEAITYALVTIWFVGGALVALVFASLGVNFYIQILIFLVSSTIFLLLTRPLIKKKLQAKVKTNVDALIGKTGIVTKQVSEFHTGLGKVNGQLWTIESYSKDTIEVDSTFIVKEVRGVRLIVELIMEV